MYEISLDTDRFAGRQAEAAMVEFLQKRFAAAKLDLIVPIGAPAAKFVVQYREQVFPEAAVVIAGADRRVVDPQSLGRNSTIVTQEIAIVESIKDIQQIAPDTENIVGIFGTSPLERFWADVDRRESGIFGNRVKFTWLTGLSLDEIEKRVSSLPPHSFIFFGLLIRDGAGVSYDGYEPLRRVKAAAKVPVYGLFQSQMGLGIIGGRLYQDQVVGIQAARAAVRIFRGEPAASIPHQVLTASSPVYDWRELKRWGIPESRLPAGSVIQFREPTFWELHRWYVIGIIAVCLIEALLIAGLVTNLVRRHRIERTLRVSEERYRLLHESMRDAFARVDMSGRILEWNPAFQQMLGYSEEELCRLTYVEITPERWFDLEERIVRDQVVSRGYSDVYEKEYRKKDGTVFPVELRTFLLRNDAREPAAMWAIVRDITERKRAETALRVSEERFRQVAETVSDYLWEVDAAGLYRYASRAVVKILGYTPEELIGKVHFYDLFAPDVREQLKAAAFKVFEARQPFRAFPNSNVSKSGKVVHLETSGVPLLDGNGHLLGYRGADSNVTERHEAEEEVRHLREKLAHFSRVATVGELTASIAHELNQPLAAILSNAQAALLMMRTSSPQPDELREILEDIAADDKRAGEVIRHLRSLLGKREIERRQLSVNHLISDVMSIIRSDSLLRNVSVVLDLDEQVPPVGGDQVQLQQVLLNLVSNAYDAMADITERTRRLVLRTRRGDNKMVLVDVLDSGVGIAPDRLQSIFESFVTTKKSGLGMGLSLASSIVRAHNGRIWAENNPDGGATFHIALPTVESGEGTLAKPADYACTSMPAV